MLKIELKAEKRAVYTFDFVIIFRHCHAESNWKKRICRRR